MTTIDRSASPPSAGAGTPERLMRRRLAAVLVLLFGALVLVGPSAGAALRPASVRTADDATVTFGLTPTQEKGRPLRANFDLNLTPGQEVRDSVRIRNLSGTQLKLNVYATDAMNTESGAVDLRPGSDRPSDLASWIELERTEITLASNDFLDIPFTLKVPTTAMPGDHTAGIVASYVGAEATGSGTVVTVDRRIGTRVLARVAGTLSPKLVVSDLKTGWSGPTNPLGGGTMTGTYRVSNDGNVRMGATQKIKIASPIGLPSKTITLAPIPDLLPGNSVVQTFAVDGVWPTFRSATKVTVSPVAIQEGDNFPAELTSSAKTATWTFPWALLALAVVLFIAWKFWQRRRRHLDAEKSAALEAIVDSRLGDPVGRNHP